MMFHVRGCVDSADVLRAEVDLINGEVIYQTQETVFHQDIQTPRKELKI